VTEEKTVQDGKFGWRGWLGVLTALAVLGGFLLALAGLNHLLGTTSPQHPKPAVSHLSNEDYGYWYCWDVGDPRPHHIGAPVSGDHMCSDVELQQATETP
jgi:hypothetical protein